jgi:hypothetical protein
MRNTNERTHSPALAVGLAIGLAALGVAALAAVVTIVGCGGDPSTSVANTAPIQSTSADRAPVAVMPAVSPPPSSSTERGSLVVAFGDSLPPDVSVTVEDSIAAPGGVVSITAQGSDDVSQIGLSDGLGRMQLFTRDPASNVWHVLYRVPLRTRKDRIALSVTALNDVNRWRRVWVFVGVQQPGADTDGEESHDDK